MSDNLTDFFVEVVDPSAPAAAIAMGAGNCRRRLAPVVAPAVVVAVAVVNKVALLWLPAAAALAHISFLTLCTCTKQQAIANGQ